MRGGDVRALGIAAVKYMALGLLFLNGGAVYESVFRSLVGAFNRMRTILPALDQVTSLGWLADICAAITSRTSSESDCPGLPAVLERLLLWSPESSTQSHTRYLRSLLALWDDSLCGWSACSGPDAELWGLGCWRAGMR